MDVKNVADTSAKSEKDNLVQNNADNQNPAGNKASLESNDAEMEHRTARSEDCEQLGNDAEMGHRAARSEDCEHLGNNAEMEHRAGKSEDCEQLGILDVLDRLQTLAG
jgi:hypothetical protein